MAIPPPKVTILSPEDCDRAVRHIANLRRARRGSVEEAIRVALEEAVKAWKTRGLGSSNL